MIKVQASAAWKDKRAIKSVVLEAKRSDLTLRPVWTSAHNTASHFNVGNVVITRELFLKLDRACQPALTEKEYEENQRIRGEFYELSELQRQSVELTKTENNLAFVFDYSIIGASASLIIVYNAKACRLEMVQDSEEFTRELLNFPNVLRTVIQQYCQEILSHVIQCASPSTVDRQWTVCSPSSTFAWDHLLYQYGAVTPDLQEWFYFLLSTLIVSERNVFPVICSEYAEKFPLFHLFCELFPLGTYTRADKLCNLDDSYVWLYRVQQQLLTSGVSFWSLSKGHKLEQSLFNEMVSQSVVFFRRHNAVEWKVGGIGLVDTVKNLFDYTECTPWSCQKNIFGIEFMKTSATNLHYQVKELLSNLPGVLVKVLAVREKWNEELLQLLRRHPILGDNKPLALGRLLEQKFPNLIDIAAMPSYIVNCTKINIT